MTGPEAARVPAGAYGEAWTDWPLFEALFQRLQRPTGAYAEALRQAGFDVAAPRPRYPTRVWGRCLEVARAHLYPQLPVSEGFRQLGTAFMASFDATTLGHFMLSGVPPRGPEGLVQRMPRYWGMTSTGTRVTVERVAEGHWRAQVLEPDVPADFTAGAIQAALRLACPSGEVTVGERLPVGYVLDFRW